MTEPYTKSSSMMYVDKLLDTYTKDDLSATVFVKVSADKVEHFGCRYYKEGVFQFDEFYPNKSVHYVESAAENWTIGVKKS